MGEAAGLSQAVSSRHLSGAWAWILRVVGVFVPLAGVAFVLDLPYHILQRTYFPQQFLGLFLGLVLFYIFLSVPAYPGANQFQPTWYDCLLGLFALSGGLYVAFYYDQLLVELGILSPGKILLGFLIILAILEATRRMTGWPVVIVAVCFILYGRFGYLLPGSLEVRPISWGRLVNQLYLGHEFLFGTPLKTAALIVLAFVLFGRLLFATGGADLLLDLARSLMGRFRGGPAKISIVSSALFGTLSGSAVGNVAAVGIVTIPLMKKTGYPSYFAAAVEAVSSTGGCILPPVMGAGAFIMAELLGVPYSEVVLTALVPALLYFLSQFIQVDLRAARLGLEGLPQDEIPPLGTTLKQGWQFLAPVAVMMYVLFAWSLRAEVAAMYSLATLILIVLIRPQSRQRLKNLGQMLDDVTVSMLGVTAVCAAAGLVIGVVSYTGLGLSLSRLFTSLGGGNLFAMAFLTALASIILGMGMPVTASYLFLAILAAPSMVSLGVEPILAHLFVFYFAAYSFITPPICVAAYTAASLAEAPILRTAWQSMRLAVAGYIVPFLFIFAPATVLKGSPMAIALAVSTAILAVAAVAISIEGFWLHRLGWLKRCLILLSAVLLVLPFWAARLTGFFLLLGLVVLVLLEKRSLATSQ